MVIARSRHPFLELKLRNISPLCFFQYSLFLFQSIQQIFLIFLPDLNEICGSTLLQVHENKMQLAFRSNILFRNYMKTKTNKEHIADSSGRYSSLAGAEKIIIINN